MLVLDCPRDATGCEMAGTEHALVRGGMPTPPRRAMHNGASLRLSKRAARHGDAAARWRSTRPSGGESGDVWRNGEERGEDASSFAARDAWDRADHRVRVRMRMREPGEKNDGTLDGWDTGRAGNDAYAVTACGDRKRSRGAGMWCGGPGRDGDGFEHWYEVLDVPLSVRARGLRGVPPKGELDDELPAECSQVDAHWSKMRDVQLARWGVGTRCARRYWKAGPREALCVSLGIYWTLVFIESMERKTIPKNTHDVPYTTHEYFPCSVSVRSGQFKGR
ncbi:hypothetical protein C8R47DRAFT_1201714 [Mycena vitilis]|nr:hypothetical protein C8R47DRAFT_1201714 [Mycena vitilis]